MHICYKEECREMQQNKPNFGNYSAARGSTINLRKQNREGTLQHAHVRNSWQKKQTRSAWHRELPYRYGREGPVGRRRLDGEGGGGRPEGRRPVAEPRGGGLAVRHGDGRRAAGPASSLECQELLRVEGLGLFANCVEHPAAGSLPKGTFGVILHRGLAVRKEKKRAAFPAPPPPSHRQTSPPPRPTFW